MWQCLNCLNTAALREQLATLVTPGKDILSVFARDALPELTDRHWENIARYPNITASKDKASKDNVQKIFGELSEHLAYGHMVVLKGPPGTGKTYMAHHYAQTVGGKSFWAGDPAQIASWLEAKTNGKPAVLIVDEANLQQPGTWEFLRPLLEESLVGKSKGEASKGSITFQDKSYILSAEHQVIFTCNPESYPGRAYHALLQDVPTVDIAKPFDDAALLKYVLQPLLRQWCQQQVINPRLADDYKKHLPMLLDTYRWLEKNLPPGQISLRDLQQMCLRGMYYVTAEEGISPKVAMQKACWIEWQYRFFGTTKTAWRETLAGIFDQSVDAELSTPCETKTTTHSYGSDYFPSKAQEILIATVIEDMLLSQMSANVATVDGAPVCKAGVLIEGASGFGKSELLRQALIRQGYQPSTPEDLLKIAKQSVEVDQKSDRMVKRFIQFTSSGDPAKDEALLRAAFDVGYAVILDELNLDPLIEGLLNHLLTGKTPEGEKAKKAGFFVLASQNSVLHAGRKKISAALQNRFHLLYVEPHGKAALLEITEKVFKNLPIIHRAAREKIVEAYLSAQKKWGEETINERRFFEGLMRIKTLCKESRLEKDAFLEILKYHLTKDNFFQLPEQNREGSEFSGDIVMPKYLEMPADGPSREVME